MKLDLKQTTILMGGGAYVFRTWNVCSRGTS